MKIGILYLFLMMPIFLFSQEKGGGETSHSERVEDLQKKKKKQEKAEKKAEKKAKKHQLDIQTKDTQKRMKKNRKRANNYNEGKKKRFWNGWFKPKR
jgi:hypothetical protein